MGLNKSLAVLGMRSDAYIGFFKGNEGTLFDT